MRLILHSSSLYILGAIVLAGIAIVLLIGVLTHTKEEFVTVLVEKGDVIEAVSVSGVVEAENSAELAFAVSGVVSDIRVTEGQEIYKGDILAELGSSQLQAERQSAVAAYQKAIADKEELVNGPQTEARALTDTSVKNAESHLAQVINEYDEKVSSTYRTLLSSNLIARTESEREDATPPTVSGSYACEEIGSYTIEPYNFDTDGFPYRISGLENGTYRSIFESPGAFGNCGLSLQFAEGENYDGSEWIIDIPNTFSSTYQTNQNNYALALEQRTTAITTAENALLLAQRGADFDNAAPRGEALIRANATILDAQARINSIDAQLRDRMIIAPFDGVITDVDILAGETASTQPVITLLASGTFDLTARIPEIDITKIVAGQNAEVIFDARPEEKIEAVISFISPLATEIDGVAYFKATITFEEQPTWLRSGLNADIDIIIKKEENILRLPLRYIEQDLEKTTVQLLSDQNNITEKEISVPFTGNNGFAQVAGIEEGARIAVPK